jgi:hypothetical protein
VSFWRKAIWPIVGITGFLILIPASFFVIKYQMKYEKQKCQQMISQGVQPDSPELCKVLSAPPWDKWL